MIAKDLMTANVACVAADALLIDAVRLMLDRKISGLPVVDKAGQLVGIITEGDLLRRAEIGTAVSKKGWFARILAPSWQADAYVHANSRKVCDLMTGDPVSVAADVSLEAVVDLMERKHIKRVPVVTDGRVVGVVSRSDLLREVEKRLAVTEAPLTDDLSIQDRATAALVGQPWSVNAQVSVTVKAGVAQIEGAIFDERVRDAIRVAVENVSGVRSVVDGMVWVDPVSGTYFPIA